MVVISSGQMQVIINVVMIRHKSGRDLASAHFAATKASFFLDFSSLLWFCTTGSHGAELTWECQAGEHGVHHRHPLGSCAHVEQRHTGRQPWFSSRESTRCITAKSAATGIVTRALLLLVFQSGDLLEEHLWGSPAAPGPAERHLFPPWRQRQSWHAEGWHQGPGPSNPQGGREYLLNIFISLFFCFLILDGRVFKRRSLCLADVENGQRRSRAGHSARYDSESVRGIRDPGGDPPDPGAAAGLRPGRGALPENSRPVQRGGHGKMTYNHSKAWALHVACCSGIHFVSTYL